MAVHLVAYGSVPILYSVFYISLNPREAPGWQEIAIDAGVKQVITSWYHCGTNAKMMVVTTVMSDVYHLLHMFHVLIRVTVTF